MTARTLAALALALLLTACGGGDWEDDTKDAGPVNCAVTPEQCK